MDVIVVVIRILITLTFLILAAGGPWAIILLRRFIKRYDIAHEELRREVEALKRWKASMENKE